MADALDSPLAEQEIMFLLRIVEELDRLIACFRKMVGLAAEGESAKRARPG